MNRKVSIIMATYNRAHLILETLESIKNQTYQNWECLIIDDGGTDTTYQTIDSFIELDSRFQFVKRPEHYKKGLPGCRNYGLDKAAGDYIIFFDDDDIVHPQNLELCLKAFEINAIDFCVYNKQPFINDLKPKSFKVEQLNMIEDINKSHIYEIITNRISIASCTVMWSKDCFNGVRFNELLMYAEEWECYPRIISNDKTGLYLKNILYFNRKHSVSNTGEFYSKSPVRVNSKKQAIRLLVNSLSSKGLLSKRLLTYFSGLAFAFRDKNLLNDIITITNTSTKNKLYLTLKFHMFPIWKFYKTIIKTANL